MTEEVMKQKYLELGITEEVYNYGTEIEKTLKERFAKIDETSRVQSVKGNQRHAEMQGKCGVFPVNQRLWL